nr:glycoside hydrolase family 97 N-terminal domain-containing protein [Prevotella sp.]
MKHRNIILAFLLLPLTAMATEVKSPNGNIVLNFTIEDGRPTYSMSYKGKEVVRPSHLGLELAKDKHASMGMNERDLMNGFSLDKEETSTFDETWQPVWGETRDIRNHYNEFVATLSQHWLTAPPKAQNGIRLKPRQHRRTILIRFRVYDDGIGFRYEFPQQAELNYFLIKEERSEFAMAGDH